MFPDRPQNLLLWPEATPGFCGSLERCRAKRACRRARLPVTRGWAASLLPSPVQPPEKNFVPSESLRAPGTSSPAPGLPPPPSGPILTSDQMPGPGDRGGMWPCPGLQVRPLGCVLLAGSPGPTERTAGLPHTLQGPSSQLCLSLHCPPPTSGQGHPAQPSSAPTGPRLAHGAACRLRGGAQLHPNSAGGEPDVQRGRASE